MALTIRPETLADYSQIAEITYLAFYREPFVDEMPLVDFLRHAPGFDPELALVAELNGKVIGHAVFTPYTLLLARQPVRAALLGPITVHPDFQRQGIGGQLLAHAHRLLKQKGFKMAFLWGHPPYYPRFGYLPRMFGKCRVRLSLQDIQITDITITERSVQPNDLPILKAMWQSWFSDVDLAVFPGDSLVDWVSHSVNIRTLVILKAEKIQGFLRYHAANPEKPRMFLTREPAATTLLLGVLRQKVTNPLVQELELPVHPAAKATREWIGYPVISDIALWNACMIKILDEQHQPLQDYCKAVSSGLRTPGLPILMPNFEID